MKTQIIFFTKYKIPKNINSKTIFFTKYLIVKTYPKNEWHWKVYRKLGSSGRKALACNAERGIGEIGDPIFFQFRCLYLCTFYIYANFIFLFFIYGNRFCCKPFISIRHYQVGSLIASLVCLWLTFMCIEIYCKFGCIF